MDSGKKFINSIPEALRIILGCFNPRERLRLFLLTFIQVTLSLLDLIAVALLGLLGSLAVSGVQSQNASGRVASIIGGLGLTSYSLQMQVTIIGMMAAGILALKTFLSLAITRKNLEFLAYKAAEISSGLVRHLTNKNLLELQSNSSQANLFAVGHGVSTLTTGILGSFLIFISDSALLIVLFSGLMLVSLPTALATVSFFALVGFILHRLLNVKVRELSDLTVKNTIEFNSRILEINQAYRELVVRNRRQFYLAEITKLRNRAAAYESKLSFVPHVSKYAMDISLVLGAILLSGLQFALTDARQAVGSLLVFLVAAMRIGPAVLRLQQGILTMRNGVTTSSSTLELLKARIGSNDDAVTEEISGGTKAFVNPTKFTPEIDMKDVTFRYPAANGWALSNCSMFLKPGSMAALVGPSGAGKTTLVDLVLGIFPPDSGQILISGVPPLEAFSTFPGSIAYVPQDVFIVNGTVRENIILGFGKEEIPEEIIWEALNLANLKDFVSNSEHKLEALVGENGSRLSGGQKQRLGIARALLTKPSLLVLDEATSALDAKSEVEVSNAIKSLKGKVTILLIAHRLSTVIDCDQVFYVEKGRIVATGSFEEVRLAIPGFAEQAKLMGIN
jgi:ABC-type multidrug transport system fused ATPase/permease subunit